MRAPARLPSTEKLDERFDEFLAALDPIFLPADPVSHDIIRYFASLLRTLGIEDKNADPYGESRETLEDLNHIMQMDLPTDRFPDPQMTVFRLGLLFYCHIVEMSAPYEVVCNLLRFRLNEGYSHEPFYKFMTSKQQKDTRKYGISTYSKIDIIDKLSVRAGLPIGKLIKGFYKPELRNAVSHSDYVIQADRVISRKGYPNSELNMTLAELDDTITSARAFVSAFFALEREARRVWGGCAHKGIPYDPQYKGIMEVLVDEDELMEGFKVHWPNGECSFYRRSRNGIDMVTASLARRVRR